MPTYQNKHFARVEAMQFNGFDDYQKIIEWMKAHNNTQAMADEVVYTHPLIIFPTQRGMMAAKPGDYIVHETRGDFYVYPKDGFEVIYAERA